MVLDCWPGSKNVALIRYEAGIPVGHHHSGGSPARAARPSLIALRASPAATVKPSGAVAVPPTFCLPISTSELASRGPYCVLAFDNPSNAYPTPDLTLALPGGNRLTACDARCFDAPPFCRPSSWFSCDAWASFWPSSYFCSLS